MSKLGIIVPYRNRPQQLRTFREYIQDYLDIDYELIVVEQDDRNDFNRGKLLNIGFLKAEELGCDYVIFHDIDMLPIDADYSYVDKPTHLITEFDLPQGVSRTMFDGYFGGVTLFPSNLFRQINGYSNKYYGWGFEDDDLFLRCRENFIDLDSKTIKQNSKDQRSLFFNGKDSYVAVPNILNTSRDFTIHTTFTVSSTPTDMTEITDEYSIWSVPGHDFALSYTSIGNFSFQFWKKDLSSIAIPSINLPLGSYSATIVIGNTHDPKKITVYINGEKVGQNTYDTLKMMSSKYLYLGVGNPDRDKKQNWFNGSISSFAVYNKSLSDNEIAQLNTDVNKSLFEYETSENLKMYYDLQYVNGNNIIDLTGNSYTGYTYNTTHTTTTKSESIEVPIPYRKTGKYKVLPHKENGYKDGYWISWKSRENQKKYIDRFSNQKSEYQTDGLESCRYRELSSIDIDNYHQITVKL